jgi:hypothetical protein
VGGGVGCGGRRGRDHRTAGNQLITARHEGLESWLRGGVRIRGCTNGSLGLLVAEILLAAGGAAE